MSVFLHYGALYSVYAYATSDRICRFSLPVSRAHFAPPTYFRARSLAGAICLPNICCRRSSLDVLCKCNSWKHIPPPIFTRKQLLAPSFGISSGLTAETNARIIFAPFCIARTDAPQSRWRMTLPFLYISLAISVSERINGNAAFKGNKSYMRI